MMSGSTTITVVLLFGSGSRGCAAVITISGARLGADCPDNRRRRTNPAILPRFPLARMGESAAGAGFVRDLGTRGTRRTELAGNGGERRAVIMQSGGALHQVHKFGSRLVHEALDPL